MSVLHDGLPNDASHASRASRAPEAPRAPETPRASGAPDAPRASRAPEAPRGSRVTSLPPAPQERVGPADPVLFGLVVALVMFGVVMVYSASSVRAVRLTGTGHAFLTKQGIYAAIGLSITWFLARLDYRRLRALAPLGLLGAIGLLLIVIVGLGHNAGGAVRWIRLGFFNIQPAEVAKAAVILWLADSLARKQAHIRSFALGFVPHAGVAALLVALCMLQPDFGSSVVLVLLTFVMMFTAGVRFIYMLGAGSLAVGLAYVALRVATYRWNRIIAFTDPMRYRASGGYQIVESWVSFSEGGLWGVGLGDSRQKMLFLPEAHTDFIAAIVAEELGFIGFALLVCAFALLVVRGLRASYAAVDPFGMYLGVGFTMFIGIQAATNLAVVLGLLPTKGLTLPFMSFGGSSLLVNCAAVGILLSVSRPGRSALRAPELAPVKERAAPVRVTKRRPRAVSQVAVLGAVGASARKGVAR